MRMVAWYANSSLNFSVCSLAIMATNIEKEMDHATRPFQSSVYSLSLGLWRSTMPIFELPLSGGPAREYQGVAWPCSHIPTSRSWRPTSEG